MSGGKIRKIPNVQNKAAGKSERKDAKKISSAIRDQTTTVSSQPTKPSQ